MRFCGWILEVSFSRSGWMKTRLVVAGIISPFKLKSIRREQLSFNKFHCRKWLLMPVCAQPKRKFQQRIDKCLKLDFSKHFPKWYYIVPSNNQFPLFRFRGQEALQINFSTSHWHFRSRISSLQILFLVYR